MEGGILRLYWKLLLCKLKKDTGTQPSLTFSLPGERSKDQRYWAAQAARKQAESKAAARADGGVCAPDQTFFEVGEFVYHAAELCSAAKVDKLLDTKANE
jgi:hypothetical protein